nr:MAG TPA: hypothetical protein [Caudoviricetes sp.]DAX88027.1 MAG TPA: hypothetical protein [Caudoviricetes sp.]
MLLKIITYLIITKNLNQIQLSIKEFCFSFISYKVSKLS